MDSITLIQDLAIVLLVAGFAGMLCKRFGLSVIVGYLVAGIIIGPHTPPFSFVLDVQRIETLSQLGLVFLMFGIGLGLSLSKLQKLGVPTLLSTALGAFFVLNLTQLLGAALGWPPTKTLFVAGLLMVSSSAVIAKMIHDMKLSRERSGQSALAITVLEDVVAVVMLTVLGSYSLESGSGNGDVAGLLAGLSAFVVLLVIMGLYFIPRLMRKMETRADPELQTIVVSGVLFLMALLAVKAGYSLALGAYLLGAIVAEMPQKGGVERSFSGMRDLFSSVFFVSIGMMIEVQLMLDVWPWILALGLFTLVARSLATGFALILVGTPPHVARRAGLLLTPLGEFTFVIAQLGVSKQVLPPEFYPIAVGVSILTVLVSPLINRHAEPFLVWIEQNEPAWVNRGLAMYHNWLAQFADLGSNQLWWQLSKKQVLQIALEALFVTGMILFSQTFLVLVQRSALAEMLTPLTLLILFWSVLGLVVLIPLFAIWRNITVLALIIAERAYTRMNLPGSVVENGFRLFSAVVIAYWLSSIVPLASLPYGIWLVIVVVLVLVLLVFSRRLIYLHSKWHHSLKDVFTANLPPAQQRLLQWQERSLDWGINLQELVIPEHAACSGSSIAELAIRSRYGCSVVEVGRHGHTIINPRPSTTLYSGDRLLLVGAREQIEALQMALGRLHESESAVHFDAARLETVLMPFGCRSGATLAELQIPHHTGVLVVGIARNGQKIINPSGKERVFAGDELLVLGTVDQVDPLKQLLAQGDVADAGVVEQ
jgi:CPA2 family monovalent cation:H+ antiporter-2